MDKVKEICLILFDFVVAPLVQLPGLLLNMLPIEPRLKPLGATILHYADGADTKVEFKRCHSYSGCWMRFQTSFSFCRCS